MTTKGLILFAALAIILASANGESDEFFVELLSPQGFRVSTNNQNWPGVQRVGFRGNINKELLRRRASQYTGDFVLNRDNFWVYENPNVSLNPGDTIYFRTQILTRYSGILDFAREFEVPSDYEYDEDSPSYTTI